MDDDELLALLARHVALLASAITYAGGGSSPQSIINQAKRFEGYLLGERSYTTENH